MLKNALDKTYLRFKICYVLCTIPLLLLSNSCKLSQNSPFGRGIYIVLHCIALHCIALHCIVLSSFTLIAVVSSIARLTSASVTSLDIAAGSSVLAWIECALVWNCSETCIKRNPILKELRHGLCILKNLAKFFKSVICNPC